eukprot:g4910.t1
MSEGAEGVLHRGIAVKAVSACVGALATNIVATPLDVVKVRLQAAAPAGGARGARAAAACSACGHFKHTDGGILERIMCAMHRRNITSPLSLFSRSSGPSATSASASATSQWPASAAAAASRAPSRAATSTTTQLPCSLCGHLKHTRGGGVLERCTPPYHNSKSDSSHSQPRSFFSRARDGFRSSRAVPRHAINPAASIPSTIASDMGAIQAMRTIARNDGVWSLWDGLRPTLVMAMPNTMLYMVMYDELAHEFLPRRFNWSEQNSAIIAGGASRAVAGAIVAPLELVRTQMQASTAIAQYGMLAKLRANVKDNGFLSLWRGLGPTLWRDVPFSVVYWYGYEFLRGSLRKRVSARQDTGRLSRGENGNWSVGKASPRVALRRFPSTELAAPHDLSPPGRLSGMNLLMISFASGAGAGGFAAFMTTPFDVVKTQRQVDAAAQSEIGGSRRAALAGGGQRVSTLQLMLNIARSEGLSGWFKGVGPRVVKVAPACAIMISTYEIGKSVFAQFDGYGGEEH